MTSEQFISFDVAWMEHLGSLFPRDCCSPSNLQASSDSSFLVEASLQDSDFFDAVLVNVLVEFELEALVGLELEGMLGLDLDEWVLEQVLEVGVLAREILQLQN